MAELLKHGDRDGRYRSPDHAAQAVALALADAGHIRDEIVEQLLDPANGAGDGIRYRDAPGGRRTPRSERGARVAAERAARKALRLVAERSPVSDRFAVAAEVAAIRAHVADPSSAHLWGGQAGSTDRVVVDAFLNIAVEARTLTPTASTRQLAERTGVHPGTISRSLRRLPARTPYLEQLEEAAGPNAGRWRLRRPVEGCGPGAALDVSPKPGRASAAPGHPARVAAHDVFAHPGRKSRPGGLGKPAARVYAELGATTATGEARTVGDLAARLGLHSRTVRRHLAALQAVGFAQHGIGDTWTADPRADLPAVARHLGVSGRSAARREYHRRERITYRLRLVEQEAARGWARERGKYRPPTVVDKRDGTVWQLAGTGSAWDPTREPVLAAQQPLPAVGAAA